MDKPQDTATDESKSNDNPPVVNPRKRRFPGPAGLLPELCNVKIFSVKKANHQSGKTVSSVVDEDEDERRRLELVNDLLSIPLSSQVEKKKYLAEAPWIELNRFLREDSEACKIMKLVKNISWIHNFAKKEIMCKPIPFLIVIIRTTPRYSTVKKGEKKQQVILEVFDESGNIDISLDGSIVKKYQPFLVPGTALAVKNAAPFPLRDVSLTIDKDDLIYISSNPHIPGSSSNKISPTKENNKENDPVENEIVHETSTGLRIIKVSKKPFLYEDLIEGFRKLTDPNLIYEKLEEDNREIVEGDYDFTTYTYNNNVIDSPEVIRYRELLYQSPSKKFDEYSNSSSSSSSGSTNHSNRYSNFNNIQNNNKYVTRSLFCVNSANESSEISNSIDNNEEDDTQHTATSSTSYKSSSLISSRRSDGAISSELSSGFSSDFNDSIQSNNNNNSRSNPSAEVNTERINDANTELVDAMNDADDEDLVRLMDILIPSGHINNSLILETPNQNSVNENFDNHENNQHQQGDNALVGEFPSDDEDDAFLANITS